MVETEFLKIYKISLDAYKKAVEEDDEVTAKIEAAKMDALTVAQEAFYVKGFKEKRNKIYLKVSEIKDAVLELSDYEGLSDLDQTALCDMQIKLYDMMLSYLK